MILETLIYIILHHKIPQHYYTPIAAVKAQWLGLRAGDLKVVFSSQALEQAPSPSVAGFYVLVNCRIDRINVIDRIIDRINE